MRKAHEPDIRVSMLLRVCWQQEQGLIRRATIASQLSILRPGKSQPGVRPRRRATNLLSRDNSMQPYKIA